MSPTSNNSTSEFSVGDHVEYQAIGGGSVANSSTTGEITGIVTSKVPVGQTGIKVNATEEDPRYVIRNDNTGKETAYKAKNITGGVDSQE